MKGGFNKTVTYIPSILLLYLGLILDQDLKYRELMIKDKEKFYKDVMVEANRRSLVRRTLSQYFTKLQKHREQLLIVGRNKIESEILEVSIRNNNRKLRRIELI